MGTRRSYSAEFKREAVELAMQPGQKITQVAEDLGIRQLRRADQILDELLPKP